MMKVPPATGPLSMTPKQLSSKRNREDKIIDIVDISVKEIKDYMYGNSVSIKDIPMMNREAICLKMEAIVSKMAFDILSKCK